MAIVSLPLGENRYIAMSKAEQDQVDAWLILHGVEPRVTPIGSRFELDTETREWRIDQFSQRDGHPYVGADGEVARHVVRRAYRSMPPWVDTCSDALV